MLSCSHVQDTSQTRSITHSTTVVVVLRGEKGIRPLLGQTSKIARVAHGTRVVCTRFGNLQRGSKR